MQSLRTLLKVCQIWAIFLDIQCPKTVKNLVFWTLANVQKTVWRSSVKKPPPQAIELFDTAFVGSVLGNFLTLSNVQKTSFLPVANVQKTC